MEKNPKKGKKVGGNGGRDSGHYNAILLEDIRSKMEFVIEHVTGVETRLSAQIQELKVGHEQRFDMVESVLRQHSQILQQHSQILQKHDRKLDKIDQTLQKIEIKLDHHDQEITLLKQA